MRLALSTSIAAICVVAPFATAHAQEAEPSGPIKISGKPPPGFEALSEEVSTVFDIRFGGKTLGATSARLDGSTIEFTDPEEMAALFPDTVLREKLIQLLSQPLPQNQDSRCLPGRTTDCGRLPLGESGVIVNPEFFQVEIFLTRDFFGEPDVGPVYLADPVSGFSLIQTGQFSLSTGRNALGDVRFGAVLDTIGSIGRTSFVAQTLVRDNSVNIQRAFAQHFWQRRRAAAGLLQDEQSVTFRNYRAIGGEFGSFFGSRLDNQEGQATPISVVLPQSATVEIYRDDVLIQTTQLEAGLQEINTSGFPTGSYPVRIIARVGSAIVVDETRNFTRVSGLPPKGETAFFARVGVRVEDRFGQGTLATFDTQPFFPQVTNEPVVALGGSRRIGEATGLSGQALFVDNTAYGEISAVTYRGNLTGLLAASAGSDGSYAAQINAALRLDWADFSLSARHARVADEDPLIGPPLDEYTPYFRSEDIVTGSASFSVLGGSLSLTGSYSKTPRFDDRYSYGFRYSRSLELGSIGSARLSFFGLAINDDKRVGISISLFRRLDRKTMLFATAGTEYRDAGRLSGQPSGVFPVAEARISRNDNIGSIDLLSQAGVSTDADRSRAFISANIASNFGIADATIDYENRRGGGGQDGISVSANAFTGFVFSGGDFSLGVREPGGDAAILVGIDRSGIPREYERQLHDDGSFNVIVGSREVAEFAAGNDTVVMLPSFREYAVQLQPEQAPPYIIDLSRRDVALYPGNVARLRFPAQLGVTVFGRLTELDGAPLSGARVSAGSDTTVTDDGGYFLLSGPLDGDIEATKRDGTSCSPLSLRTLFDDGKAGGTAGYLRLGDVQCR